jgi:hypothetical protein
MRFTIRGMLLIATFAAIIFATVKLVGIEGILLLFPPVICYAAFGYLKKHDRTKAGWIVVSSYLIVWALTATFGPNSTRIRFTQRIRDKTSRDITEIYVRKLPDRPTDLEFEEEPPWHYIRILSTPCPLIVVADYGMMGKYPTGFKSGYGGRAWFLWLFRTWGPVYLPLGWSVN